MKFKSLSQILSACCLVFICSCTNETSTSAKNEIVFRSLTEKEYQAASPFIKRLIDKIDASVTAFNFIKKIAQYKVKLSSLLVGIQTEKST